MQKICKIGSNWKSFNTRTIGSSPANRSTFLHTTCLRFSFSLRLCLVLSATQYQVQLMYQHGSATPDTFSRLPAMRFLPLLRYPDLQHPEVAQYAHWLPASGCFLFLPPPGSGTVFLLPYPSPRLCRSTSDISDGFSSGLRLRRFDTL